MAASDVITKKFGHVRVAHNAPSHLPCQFVGTTAIAAFCKCTRATFFIPDVAPGKELNSVTLLGQCDHQLRPLPAQFSTTIHTTFFYRLAHSMRSFPVGLGAWLLYMIPLLQAMPDLI